MLSRKPRFSRKCPRDEKRRLLLGNPVFCYVSFLVRSTIPSFQTIPSPPTSCPLPQGQQQSLLLLGAPLLLSDSSSSHDDAPDGIILHGELISSSSLPFDVDDGHCTTTTTRVVKSSHPSVKSSTLPFICGRLKPYYDRTTYEIRCIVGNPSLY